MLQTVPEAVRALQTVLEAVRVLEPVPVSGAVPEVVLEWELARRSLRVQQPG